jgi:hypothetical protein
MIAPLARFIDWSADMKKILTTCGTAPTGIRGLLQRNNRFIAAQRWHLTPVSPVSLCFGFPVAGSHRRDCFFWSLGGFVRASKISMSPQKISIKPFVASLVE